jgi:hypothetical protein
MFHPFYSILSCFIEYAFTKNIYSTYIEGQHNQRCVIVLPISNPVVVPVRYFVVLPHCIVHSSYVAHVFLYLTQSSGMTFERFMFPIFVVPRIDSKPSKDVFGWAASHFQHVARPSLTSKQK